ncbi:SlyX family protein [Chitinivorax sp. PXF-14]|uniref:SlyX family protein n=1 Tax=Chitinivorax sp. PXF-14 TaxID=3230488 RepID=UPI003465A5B4
MEDRLTELEIKISFQEELLEALNETVIRQQQQLDLLQGQLRLLYQQIKANSGITSGTPQQEIPPHY